MSLGNKYMMLLFKKRDLIIEKHTPLPFYATQITNPFLIHGSQPIMIKWKDFQPMAKSI